MQQNPTIIAELRGAVLPGSYQGLLKNTLKSLENDRERAVEFSSLTRNETFTELRQKMQLIWTFSRFGIKVKIISKISKIIPKLRKEISFLDRYYRWLRPTKSGEWKKDG